MRGLGLSEGMRDPWCSLRGRGREDTLWRAANKEACPRALSFLRNPEAPNSTPSERRVNTPPSSTISPEVPLASLPAKEVPP